MLAPNPRNPELTTGTAYVIVLGVKVIDFLPSTTAVYLSPLVNNKSPCNTPLIPNLGRYCNATFNLSANAPP